MYIGGACYDALQSNHGSGGLLNELHDEGNENAPRKVFPDLIVFSLAAYAVGDLFMLVRNWDQLPQEETTQDLSLLEVTRTTHSPPDRVGLLGYYRQSQRIEPRNCDIMLKTHSED